MIGAWPVVGFMGLDVALVYVAFKLNFRALRLYETVELDRDGAYGDAGHANRPVAVLEFQSVLGAAQPRGAGRPDVRTVARPATATRLVLASFLTDPEREDFATALNAALQRRDAREPGLSGEVALLRHATVGVDAVDHGAAVAIE